MKKIFFSVFLLNIVFSINLNAQIRIATSLIGKITDEHKSPAAFATIKLLKASDSTFIKGATSLDDGKFVIQVVPGKYLISVSMLGYAEIKTAQFLITENEQTHDIGVVQISLISNQLAAVSVISRKSLIERQLDKVVLNIENSVVATGNSALEILQRAPGVSVGQSGVISLQGKQGVAIMIDGKPSYLSGEDLTNLLNATQGTEIQSIELITNPSSKYDAAGSAGIINIKLKRNKNFGTNGTASVGIGYGKYTKENGDISLNHRQDKVNVFAALSFNHNKRWLDNDITHINNTSINQTFFTQNGRTLGDRYTTNYKAGLDYFIDPKSILGFSVNGNIYNGYENGNVQTLIGPSFAKTDSSIKANNPAVAKNRNLSLNLNYKKIIDTAGQEINFDFDYSSYNRNRADTYNNYFLDSAAALFKAQIFRNFTPAKVQIWSAKSDYTWPVNKTLKLEAGLKSSFVKTDNNSLFQNFGSGQWLDDLVKTDHFIYDENINAVYVNAEQHFKYTSILLGLRAEQTNSTGNSVANQNIVALHYFNLFPSLFINQVISPKNEIGLAYSRRIDRPDYASLNPFIKYIDLYSYNVGNPYLKSQLTNSVELSYSYDKSFSASVGFSHTGNVISEVVTADTLKKTLYNMPQNIAVYQSVDLNINAPIKFTNWWESNNNVTAFYGKFTSPDLLGKPYSSGRVVLEVSTTQTINLSSSSRLEISGSIRTKGLEGTFTIQSQHRVDAGFSKSFLSRNLNLKVAVNDLLNSWKLVTNSTLPSQQYSNYVKAESRVLRLTCSYRLGSTSVKSQRQHQTGAGDEQNRVKQ